MLIWLNLLIPLIAILILAIKFKKKIDWWEYLLIFTIPCIAIGVAKVSSVMSLTCDTEYWNSYIVRAQYEEPWNEWIEEECCSEDCDSDGNCTQTCWDCSYCSNHGASWTLYDNIGKSYKVSQAHYKMLVGRWNNETKNESNKRCECDCYGNKDARDGDAFYTNFDNQFDHTEPVCKQYLYENKIQCSKSLFNYEEVDSADSVAFGLLRYPWYEKMTLFTYNPIVGWNDVNASRKLNFHNAHLGAKKQVHMMIAVYHNQPVSAFEYQKSLWKNGNKNEVILCIGLKDNKEIAWAKVMTWCEVDRLKFGMEQTVQNMDFNLTAIVDTMASMVDKQFVRKEFADFNYIKVEPTGTAVAIAFFVTLILTIGLSIFSVVNPFDWGHSTGRSNYGGRWSGRVRRF